MRNTLLVAALAATAVASPAFAQQASVNPPATAKGVVLLPLTLTESQQLDFGTVIASTTTAGNVVIDANTGARTFPVPGSVVGVPGYNGGRGLFQGAGTAGRDVLLTLTPPAVLTSGTNTLTVNGMTFDTCGCTSTTRTLNAGGSFTIGVGGDFQIAANQPNGVYSATYDVTADYQ